MFRARSGLLHQGSVAAPAASADVFRCRAELLAGRLATTWEPAAFGPPAALTARLMASRSAHPAGPAHR